MSDQENIDSVLSQQIKENPIILYMKGSPQLPQCGFSQRVVNILAECKVRFAFVDVLTNPKIRAGLPDFAKWPTFPQLWVNEELIGGCDIVTELYENGELQEILAKAVVSDSEV